MQLKKENTLGKNAGMAVLIASMLVGIAMSVVFVLAQNPDRATVDQVASSSTALEKRYESTLSRAEAPKPPDVSAPLARWRSASPTREDLPAWVFNRRPEVVVRVKPPVDKRKDLFPPTEVMAAVVPDFRVEISWQNDPRTTAAVKGFKVFRWEEGGQMPGDPIHEELVEGVKYTDENPDVLFPLKKYFYCVKAVTDEEVKTPGGKESACAPVAVSMPDDRQVSYYGEGSMEMALVYVKRYHRGEWVEQKFSVYLGDFAGREETVEVKGEKTRIDFSLDRILADIAQETRKDLVEEKVQKRDASGKLEFDENGQPVYDVRKREILKIEDFVVLVDRSGDELRVPKTEKVIPPPKQPDADAPYFDIFLWDLQMRLRQAPDPVLRRFLQRRIAYMQKSRPKLVGKPEDVDRNMLEKKGLLFEKRWEWLLAKRKAAKSRNRPADVQAAEEISDNIRDLEHFLSPVGWDTEKEEWERDYREFERTFGQEPAKWSIPPRPEKPKNTAGGK